MRYKLGVVLARSSVIYFGDQCLKIVTKTSQKVSVFKLLCWLASLQLPLLYLNQFLIFITFAKK